MQFLFYLFAAGAMAATLVTRTVGQVGDYVVTSREVQISMILEQILFPAKEAQKEGADLKPDQPEFRNAVTAVLLEAVVSLEAENFKVSQVSEADLAEAMSKIEKSVVHRALWGSLEPSSSEVRKFAQRKLSAKNFLKFKTNSLAGIITDQEAQAYYEKNRVKFGSLPFTSFKDNIKTFLGQQQLEERLRAWFEAIKHKYKVRNFIVS